MTSRGQRQRLCLYPPASKAQPMSPCFLARARAWRASSPSVSPVICRNGQTPYSQDEVIDAVDALLPAIEIVGGRFEGGFNRIGPIRLIADMVAHTAFVSGQETTNWRGIDLRSHSVSLFKNGEQVGEGTGSLVLGDPLLVLHWTANHLLDRGESIKAGQIVTTGTCTGITPVAEDDVFTADFGTLGKVEVRIVPKRGTT